MRLITNKYFVIYEFAPDEKPGRFTGVLLRSFDGRYFLLRKIRNKTARLPQLKRELKWLIGEFKLVPEVLYVDTAGQCKAVEVCKECPQFPDYLVGKCVFTTRVVFDTKGGTTLESNCSLLFTMLELLKDGVYKNEDRTPQEFYSIYRHQYEKGVDAGITAEETICEEECLL